MKTIYKCEMCEAEFTDWQECSKHEKSHPRIEEAKLLFGDPEKDVPSRVSIEFSNGMAGIYTLETSYLTKAIELIEKEKPAEAD